MLNILIACPAYGGDIKTAGVTSIISAVTLLTTMGAKWAFASTNSSNIVYSRNYLATQAVNENRTHILFIDADMDVRPETLKKMIGKSCPVIGCVYPKRAETGFVVWFDGASISGHGDVASVGGIGMGFCLIATDVLRKLIPSVTVNTRDDHKTFGFFDVIRTDNGVLTEDLSFCKRWRNAGGQVLALLNEDIGHVGEFTYRRNYLGHLKSH